MNDAPDGPSHSKAGKKANLPLILALAGVLISILSESIKDEATSYAVFALGIACTICALLFVIFRRKKAPSS